MAKNWIPTIISVGVLVTYLSVGLGCTDNNTSEEATIEPDPVAEESEDGVESASCDGVECKVGTSCVEGVCEVEVTEGYGCGNPFKLGVLSGDEVHRFSANPQGQPNLLSTSCSVDDHSAQGIFKFQVDEPTLIKSRIASSSHILVQELRVGSCTNESAISFCSINKQDWTALPGEDYFLIVEARRGDPGEGSVVGESGLINEFELEIETRSFECFPAGEKSCVGNEVEYCAGGQEIRSFGCATGCNEGECLGDSCQNPIVVNDSMNLQAELSSFTNTINFVDSPSCTSSGSTGSGSSTLGQDVVFHLPGLSGGQTVEVKAPDSSFVLAIVDQCQQNIPICKAGDDLTGSLRWEVERSGDYYVVANRFLPSSGSAEFEINIVD